MRVVEPIKVLTLVSVLGFAAPLPVEGRRLAPGHVPAIVKHINSAAPLRRGTPLRLAIGLPLRHTNELDGLLRNICNPASPDYHRYLTVAEFTARFGPDESDYQAVIQFARAHHLAIAATHPNRLVLDVVAPVENVEQAFAVHFSSYYRPDGSGVFFAPDVEPSVPDEIPILDVSGLSNYQPPRAMVRQSDAIQSWSETPWFGSGPASSYIGGDFRAAYAPGVSLTGAGQSVGLVEFDGFYTNDITNYEGNSGLAPVPVQTVLLDDFNGVPLTGTEAANIEVALDIEMAMAMAPKLASIISYEAGPSGVPNDVLNRIVTDDTAAQISCSWSWGGGPTAATDQIFQEMAAQGQSFFCASGDSGAYVAGAIDNPGRELTPVDNPYLTSVGGTALLTTGALGSWVSEQVWAVSNGDGSSGGISSYYPIPYWQQGVSMAANGGSTNMRNIPDVALTAQNVYADYNNGSWSVLSGTSCAAPLWAGFTALVNQQAANYGIPSVGFLNPALYALGQGTNYNSVLHDITAGSNTNGGSTNEFFAVPGYDLCTGWGTPAGAALINALAPMPDSLLVRPAAGFKSFALAGGPFPLRSQTFILTNGGTAPLAWSLSGAGSWLNVSPPGGTLLPGEASAVVSVNLTPAATNLPPGTNIAVLWFTNTSDGYVTSRQFTLITSLQLVQNGGFETGNFADWIQAGNTFGTFVSTNSQFVHSGSYGVCLGPPNTNGSLAQTLFTVPGQQYALSFWLDNPGPGATNNQFSVSWNGSNVWYETNVPVMAWSNVDLFVTATSTNTVLQFSFLDDPQYLGLDDVSVAPMMPLSLQGLTMANGKTQFAVKTTFGASYQAQYATNLLRTNWHNLGAPFFATNTSMTVTDSNAVNAQRFYRAFLLP